MSAETATQDCPEGYPGDQLIDEANTLRELLAHPLIRATISLNAHNLTDMSDTAIDTVCRLARDRRARDNGSTEASR